MVFFLHCLRRNSGGIPLRLHFDVAEHGEDEPSGSSGFREEGRDDRAAAGVFFKEVSGKFIFVFCCLKFCVYDCGIIVFVCVRLLELRWCIFSGKNCFDWNLVCVDGD